MTVALAGIAAVCVLPVPPSSGPLPPTLTTADGSAGCPAPSPAVRLTAPGTGRTVALTFDDGPGPSTAATLRVLMRYGVRATFFDAGVRMQAHPGLVRATAAQGHLVGNHTWSHPHLPTLAPDDQLAEIERTTTEQVALLGSPPCVFRPPFGQYDDSTLAAATAAGMTVWNWTQSTQDWKAEGCDTAYWVDRIVARAMAGLQGGSHPVLLLHNGPAPGDPPNPAGDPATVRALPRIIAAYRARGYSFVDLLGRRGFAPYAPTGASAPAIAVTAGGLHALFRDRRGRLVEVTRILGGWGRARVFAGVRVSHGPAAVATGPLSFVAAVTTGAGHVRLVALGDRGSAHWTGLGGSTVGRPALAYDAAHRVLTVATRTTAGTVALRQRVRGRWQHWRDLGGSFGTAPALAVDSGGILTLAAVDAAGRVEVRHLNGAGSAWRQLDGVVTSDPALVATPDGHGLLLLARSATGSLLRRTGDADLASWGSWTSMHGIWASGPAASSVAGVVTVAVTATDGTIRLTRSASPHGDARWWSWQRTGLTAPVLP